MKRSLRADELRLWAEVAASIRPMPGRAAPAPPPASPPAPPAPPAGPGPRLPAPPAPEANLRPAAGPAPPAAIEPLRRRRLARGRDPIAWSLDLHGLDQDRARERLIGFLQRAHAEGQRAVLVITGKGPRGDGVLRRRAPDWLEDPRVRPVIAGVSPADRRHGGAGAFYVALKRRT
jgi:DNA-nicking Smr family endonuclease